jgi:membrane protease YdiL (CAAX protease family)
MAYTPTEETDILTRRYFSLMALGIILPFLLTPFLSMMFLSADQSIAFRLTCSRFLIWGVAGLMFLYARQAEVQKYFLWDEKTYKISFYLASVGILFLLLIADNFIAYIPYRLGLHEKSTMIHKMAQAMKQYPVLLVFTAFTAGVTEEFIFRGYMISRLSLFFRNKGLPVVIAALLFAAVHLGYHHTGELIFTFLFGLIFGYHYQKYRNIKVLIIVHFLWDIFATLPALKHR